jgi:hypothetical protein
VVSGSGCLQIKTTKSVATMLKTYERLPVGDLIERVNALQTINSLRGTASIRLTDLKLAEEGKIEPYRPADGLIVVKRPEQVRVVIRAPIVKQNIADMVSDGQKFRIAVFQPAEYRRFLIGSNDRDYESRIGELGKMEQGKRQQISSIARVRPQHLTDALLVPKIDKANVRYFASDLLREELDIKPGLKPRPVMRSYQILHLLTEIGDGQLRLLRQYWFDRTNTERPLVKVENFNAEGGLTTITNYRNYHSLANTIFPKTIEIVRMQDQYSLELNFNDLEENADVALQVFMLENTENLPEKDLDTR